MTSKISSFKLMKEDLKRRSWLVALTMLGYFICLPVALLLKVDEYMNLLNQGYYKISQIQEMYKNFMGTENIIVIILIIATATAAGISGYSYLHSRVKLDFYHSLAIPRKKLFFNRYLVGVMIFLVPYILSMLLCLAVGAVNGLLTGEVVAISLKLVFVRLLEYLGAYGTGILATIMTGKVIIAVLGTVVFAGYFPSVAAIMDGLSASFFSTYAGREFFIKHAFLASPALSGPYAESLMENMQCTKWVLLGMGVLILWILITTGTAVWLNGIRKSEAAEKSMAFPKTEGVIKVLLVIPISLAVGLYFKNMVVSYSTFWFFGGTIFAIIVLSAVIEFIYHLNMKEVFKHKLQIGIAGVIAIVLALGSKYDWLGYDTYLPDEGDVEQMAVYDPSLMGGFSYAEDGLGYGITYTAETALDMTLTKDFGVLYELAQKGARDQVYGDEISTQQIVIKYKLKSGKKVMRSYVLPIEDIDKMYREMFEKEEYRKIIYPVFERDEEKVRHVTVYSKRTAYETLDLTAEKRHQLLEIYKEELKNASYDEIRYHAVGTIGFEIDSVQQEDSIYTFSSSEDGYPIGENFTKTIGLLNEILGYEFTKPIEAEEVEAIYVTDYRSPMDQRQELEFAEKQDIEEILQEVSYYTSTYQRNDLADVDIRVQLKNGKEVMGGFYFIEGKVPSLIDNHQ